MGASLLYLEGKHLCLFTLKKYATINGVLFLSSLNINLYFFLSYFMRMRPYFESFEYSVVLLSLVPLSESPTAAFSESVTEWPQHNMFLNAPLPLA